MNDYDIEIPPCRQVLDAAGKFGSRIALIHGDRSWTFTEFLRQVERLACGLQSLGIGRGDRVCIWMNNCAEMVFLQFALEAAGIVRVAMNARYTPLEADQIAADCGPAAVFVDASRSGKALANHATVTVGTSQWDALLNHPVSPEDLYRVSGDDLCSLNYTSGSTGSPKGVMLSHRNWMAVYRNMLTDRDIRTDDRLVHIGPLSHSSGAYVAAWLLKGATNVLSPRRGGIEGLLKTIETHRCSVLTCVPTVIGRILSHRKLKQYDLSSLRQIGYGAEPIASNVLQRAIDQFGEIFVQNYGLTEAMMTVCTLGAAEHRRNGELVTGAIGRPYSDVEVVLRDKDGNVVADGEIGELTIRSDHVMQGYWRNQAATEQVLRDGWLYSGDLARRDEDGIYYLAGRKKDIIICGGFNIYPPEVAAVIAACPGVDDATVLGQPDERWGEIPVAFVAGRNLDRTWLVNAVKPALGVRTPKRWVIMDELPKTANGKVDSKQLRREFIQA